MHSVLLHKFRAVFRCSCLALGAPAREADSSAGDRVQYISIIVFSLAIVMGVATPLCKPERRKRHVHVGDDEGYLHV